MPAFKVFHLTFIMPNVHSTCPIPLTRLLSSDKRSLKSAHILSWWWSYQYSFIDLRPRSQISTGGSTIGLHVTSMNFKHVIQQTLAGILQRKLLDTRSVRKADRRSSPSGRTARSLKPRSRVRRLHKSRCTLEGMRKSEILFPYRLSSCSQGIPSKSSCRVGRK